MHRLEIDGEGNAVPKVVDGIRDHARIGTDMHMHFDAAATGQLNVEKGRADAEAQHGIGAGLDPAKRLGSDDGFKASTGNIAAITPIGDTTAGGKDFAGGLACRPRSGPTTNITPDRDTGIGTWSEAAFQRAMHEGVDREGNHLYPAFPYDHFTHVTDADVSAFYAYLMTRQPVSAEPPANELPDGVTTVWTHTQGVYPDRDAIAEMLGVDKPMVHCVHVEGSGCYGHNGADDAAEDAALLARAVPGKPVRVQYMREQEHAWEPYGPGMVTHITAGIDETGKIAAWDYELWSNNHGTRPGTAGALVSARHLATPFAPDVQELRISPNGNGDRNADPGYTLPQKHVIWHFLADMPLRVSALRALGAYANVFSAESAMDELALLAETDPVVFRLKHLDDPRGRDVIAKAAENFNWLSGPLTNGNGRGFAYARYKNHAAYLALAVEVQVNRNTGRVHVVRANAAVGSGEVVNPDGIINQIQGGIIQSMGWTVFEGVTFDRTRITSIDWSAYPILRFDSVPDSIDVAVMSRPGDPFLGTGEAAQGPTPSAIGNAIRNALGVRLHDLPLTLDKVKAAIAASGNTVTG